MVIVIPVVELYLQNSKGIIPVKTLLWNIAKGHMASVQQNK